MSASFDVVYRLCYLMRLLTYVFYVSFVNRACCVILSFFDNLCALVVCTLLCVPFVVIGVVLACGLFYVSLCVVCVCIVGAFSLSHFLSTCYR